MALAYTKEQLEVITTVLRDIISKGILTQEETDAVWEAIYIVESEEEGAEEKVDDSYDIDD